MLKFTLMNVMAAGVRVQDVWQGPIISVATHDSVAYKMKENNRSHHASHSKMTPRHDPQNDV